VEHVEIGAVQAESFARFVVQPGQDLCQRHCCRPRRQVRELLEQLLRGLDEMVDLAALPPEHAYDGERRMRPELQERAPLGQQRLARLVGREPADLQRHEAVVPAVDRPDDLAVAALAEHLEEVVTITDQACHARIVRASSGPSCSAVGSKELREQQAGRERVAARP